MEIAHLAYKKRTYEDYVGLRGLKRMGKKKWRDHVAAVRTALAGITAMFLSIALGPWMIQKLRELQIGQHIREEGPKSHQKKAGTPTMGGVLIGVIGVAGCLLVNAVSFLAIIVTLVVMEIPPGNAKIDEATHFWQEVAEGYRFLHSERRLLSVILLTYGVAMVGTPYSRFLPVFATDVLHAGPTTFGLLLAAPGVGAVFAGLGIASLGRLRRRLHFVAAAVLGFSISLMRLCNCRNDWLALRSG